MRYVFLICTFFCIRQAYGQAGYSIVYERTKLIDTSDKKQTPQLARMVFNDSASFFYHYHYNSQKDPLMGNKRFGKRPGNHSFYFIRSTAFLAEGHEYPEFKRPLLSVDTSKKYSWVLIGNKKIIAGYECSAALSVNKNNDSLLAFYTTAILPLYGPAWFTGLPGTILEVYDQASNWHLVALKVEKGEYAIVLPKKAIILSREELSMELGKRRETKFVSP